MIDERYIELMNGEIDGANSPEESAELKRYLESSLEAQSYFEGLRQLDQIFEEAKKKLPPEQVRQNILTSIYARKEAPEKKNTVAAVFSLFKKKPSRRFVYAFAAGIIFGLCLFAVIIRFVPGSTSPDLEKLYGTLAILEGKKPFFNSNPVDFKLDEVSGSARFRYAKEKIFAELKLVYESDIQVILQYDPDIQFAGLNVEGSGDHQIEIKESEARLILSGASDYNLTFIILTNKHRTRSPINIKIVSAKGQLFEKSIHPR
jgi:hypothetical protein